MVLRSAAFCRKGAPLLIVPLLKDLFNNQSANLDCLWCKHVLSFQSLLKMNMMGFLDKRWLSLVWVFKIEVTAKRKNKG